MRNLIVLLLFPVFCCRAQSLVFDRNHFNIVTENGMVRLAAENAHNSYLKTIHTRLSDISLNISSVILVQSMIRNSLVNVNEALKSGLAVKQIIRISGEIVSESNQMIAVAGTEPYLALFAEDVARQLKNRGMKLVAEVSDFVLKEDVKVMMDYEKRDMLLRKVTLELKVMRALCYSMSRSMYWAKVNGVLKTANPYRNFMNQDKWLAEDILRNYQLLKE